MPKTGYPDTAITPANAARLEQERQEAEAEIQSESDRALQQHRVLEERRRVARESEEEDRKFKLAEWQEIRDGIERELSNARRALELVKVDPDLSSVKAAGKTATELAIQIGAERSVEDATLALAAWDRRKPA